MAAAQAAQILLREVTPDCGSVSHFGNRQGTVEVRGNELKNQYLRFHYDVALGNRLISPGDSVK